ncbi:EAL domain-containing protein [Marinobacter sp. X15-166B]|uniref:EAL domain-containing protein n=1 Tax=Marinobacter sp. X15-166B TaxID=1897620 RepID=UPI000AF27951|nr:EAL domain-containing protein [Marinobacter sp. X15-166B]
MPAATVRLFKRRPVSKISVAALLAALVFALLYGTNLLERPEAGFRDQIVALLIKEQPSNLLILEIDSTSIETVGQWPWPRSVFAAAITALDQAGIRSLMVDVDFSAVSTLGGDAELEEAIRSVAATVPTYLPVFVQRRSHGDGELMIRRPLSHLSGGAELVAVNMQPEQDGLVRFLSVGFRWQEGFYRGAWNALAGHSDAGTWVDYSISPASFHYIRFIDLLEGRVPAHKLHGRDVIIGATAIELGDMLATPVHQVLPGAVIQALGAQTLRNGGLHALTPMAAVFSLALFWLGATLVFSRCSWWRGLQVLGLFVLCSVGLFVWAYQGAGLIVYVFNPVLLCGLVYVAINLARLDTATLERLWLQISLRDNEALLDRIVATTNDYILCVDADGVITKANQAILTLCDMSEAAMCNSPLSDCLPEARQGVLRLPSTPFDTQLVTRSGLRIPVQATVSRVATSGQAIFTVVLRDLSERVAREQELEYRATYDGLTGLLNRSAFFERVVDSLQYHPSGCLICVDIDYFREVNDTYGHVAGDQLLKTVAQRIAVYVAALGPCARIGGDGFALWLAGQKFAAGGQRVCERLLEEIERPHTLDANVGASVQVSATAGVADYEHHDSAPAQAETLLRQALDATRLAKQEGVAVRCYSQSDSQAAMRRLELVPAIRSHINSDAFQLLYQPKLDLETLTPVGCEALLRWPRNDGEMVSVDQLIAVAENSRQIAPLTRWVVETLLAQEAHWQQKGWPRNIALNLSPRLFQDRNFIAGLKDLLRSSRGYYSIECEITETALLGNENRALALFDELVDSGATLAIDDYGTGYSSLAYLQSIRASVLKIDRSFVTGIQQSPANQVIVRSTINMAHELGMRVVAEGVETPGDEQFLRVHRCDLVQGYLYARPLALPELERWLATRISEPVW